MKHRQVSSSWIILALVLTVAGWFGLGCASVSIESNRDPNVSRTFHRIYVLINHGDVATEGYPEALKAQLESAFLGQFVEYQVEVLSPLQLDERESLRNIREFQPEAVLVVKLSSAVLSEYGDYPVLVYDVSLFSPELDRRYWRAKVNNTAGVTDMDSRMRKMADKVVAQLRGDRLL